MEKIKWFEEARFGLFIHWGIYAIPACGEWTYAQDQWGLGGNVPASACLHGA